MTGKVYLVGAGPGDPDLLTVKAARLLAAADVVLYDALVSPEVLALTSSRARLVPVGKRCGRKRVTQEEINALLIHHARRVAAVVRLKGGDPLLFGRAAEEMDALRAAGVPFEVVPGITAASAAAAAAGLALTDRRSASQVLFTTAHRQNGRLLRWRDLDPDTTLVIYMPGSDYSALSGELQAAGLGDSTPCLIVSAASLPEQCITRTTLACLGREQAPPAPALLIVGEVARPTGRRAARSQFPHCHPKRSEGVDATEPAKDPYFLDQFA